MKKGSFFDSLSALVLLAFAVIWIINICVGIDNMTPKLSGGIDIAYAVIFICIFIVYVFGDKSLPNGFGWLIGLIALLYIPTLITALLSIFGVDLIAMVPFLQTVLTISQAVVYIPFYIIIVYRSCLITDSWIFRLIFIIIGLFLSFCVIANLIPSLRDALPFPMIGI